jgi:NAD(P)-dependent dehydrogenase (short-subunit alcohol dehydrogenase family)
MTNRSLQDAVVVITGASSGIGRAAALAFAERGAHVVVAARRQDPLDMLVMECERATGRTALAVPTDVADETSVRNLARQAVERLGRIDVWVNNAGVYAAGRFEDTPSDVFERVIDVNLLGCVHGARAALPHLRRQRGVLINTASVDSAATFPYFTAYVASKWAVRGFSASLRQEMRGVVDVCTILPAAIDTPLFQHAANYMGLKMKALNPTYDPEQVAAAMVRCAERGGPREVIVGTAGKLLALQYTLAPGLSERIFTREVQVDHFEADHPTPATSGNVLNPMAEGLGASGGWKSSKGHAGLSPALAGLLAVGLSAAGGVVAWRRAHARRSLISPLR